MSESAQSARGESLCGFCHRPWFGQVAYCPYCGHRAAVATVGTERDDGPAADETAESEQQALWMMPADTLHQPMASPPEQQARQTPLQAVPPPEDRRPAAAQSNKKALPFLFKAVVGATALLLIWIAIKLLALLTDEGVSPQPPIRASGTTIPRPDPAVSASPPPAAAPRTGTPVSPRPRNPLCSPAHEAAGLCKAQE